MVGHIRVGLLLMVLTMASLLRPVGAMESQVQPSPALQAIADLLNRLMVANPSVQQPVSLRVKPFMPPPCALAGATGQGSQGACQSDSGGPSWLSGSHFASFVDSLRDVADPTADAQRLSVTERDRTILVNLSRLTDEPSASSAALLCHLGRDLASLQLNHVKSREDAFAAINSKLASRLRNTVGKATAARRRQEASAFLLSPLGMVLSKATSGGSENPTTIALSKSPQWSLLRQRAPAVAAPLRNLRTLPKDKAREAWDSVDPIFAFALQDRLEVLERQRIEAEKASLSLLARAGVDPGSCAEWFDPPPTTHEVEVLIPDDPAVWGRSSRPQRPLPQRFHRTDQRIEIIPRPQPARSSHESEGLTDHR